MNGGSWNSFPIMGTETETGFMFDQSFSEENVFAASLSGKIIGGFLVNPVNLSTQDPTISFTHSFSNLGNAPVLVGFAFGPVATGINVGSTNVFASQGVSLTDSNQSGAASIAAALAGGDMMENFADANTWGVNPAFAPVGVPGFTASNSVNVLFGNFPATNNLFSERVAYMLSAGDFVGMTGLCRYDPVPLPPSAFLLGSGLLGLVGLRRFRKS